MPATEFNSPRAIAHQVMQTAPASAVAIRKPRAMWGSAASSPAAADSVSSGDRIAVHRLLRAPVWARSHPTASAPTGMASLIAIVRPFPSPTRRVPRSMPKPARVATEKPVRKMAMEGARKSEIPGSNS